jgi:phospholipid-binding lipoprotein MlaA
MSWSARAELPARGRPWFGEMGIGRWGLAMEWLAGRRAVATAALAGVLLTYGCSTLPKTGPETVPPLRKYEDVVTTPGPHPLEVADPLEGFNRGVYRFNYYFDEYLLLPVVRAYEFILPDYVEDRISSAVDNIGEFGNLTNSLLQLKFKDAGITLSRFVINSTVGVAGLWDPATAWGLERQPEDFGQTLGRYGVGSGAYLVLPVFGPSSARDAVGLAADSAAFNLVGPSAWVNEFAVSAAYAGTAAVDRRHRIPLRYYESGSPFEYELLRMVYPIRRELEVAD